MGNEGKKYGIKDWLEIIYFLCTIFGSTIIGIISVVSSYFGGIPIFLLFTFVLIQIIHTLIVPLYKNKREGISWEEAKPSVLGTVIVWIIITILLCYIFLLPKFVEASNNTGSNVDAIINIIDNFNDMILKKENNTDDVFDLIQTKDVIVEYYIIRGSREEISREEFEEIPSDMLYLIRNGYFAYCGLYFESQYYERFDWYNAYIMSEDQFDWKLFNVYQIENIERIKHIEKLRKK